MTHGWDAGGGEDRTVIFMFGPARGPTPVVWDTGRADPCPKPPVCCDMWRPGQCPTTGLLCYGSARPMTHRLYGGVCVGQTYVTTPV